MAIKVELKVAPKLRGRFLAVAVSISELGGDWGWDSVEGVEVTSVISYQLSVVNDRTRRSLGIRKIFLFIELKRESYDSSLLDC